MRGSIDVYAHQAETALEHLARAGWDAGDEQISEVLYRAIRDLAAGARYFTEVTEHLSNGIAARAELGQLRLDSAGVARYPTPDVAVGTARLALADATEAARALAVALDETQQITSTIIDPGTTSPGQSTGETPE